MLGVAVSGGADSVALLLLANTAYPGSVAAATVDHGLRSEAAAEAAWVADLCKRLDVPHATLRKDPRLDVSALRSVQERARAIRYYCLTDWSRSWHPDLVGSTQADWVAVAHHRDDVAESFLMRAQRGAGVAGLAEMPRLRALDASGGMLLLRPLLSWSRAELAAIVGSAGISPIIDPSNDEQRFDRVRARRLLAANPQLAADRLARASRNLRDVEDALEWFVLGELSKRFAEDEYGDLWLRAADLPFELQRRFVIRAVEGVRQENGIFDAWRATRVDRLISALRDGHAGTIAGVQARPIDGRWCFRMAPPHRDT